MVSPRRGHLRVLLGAAPGVGKTFAMLAEGEKLASQGVDVVVALRTHGADIAAEEPHERLMTPGTNTESPRVR